ncbi:MAG: hypothetical protein WA874_01420 [Chryseosolibacter sp.]
MEAATTVRDLKTIICTIIENHPGVGIRFRTLGQLWYPGFLKIVKIDDKRLQLFDETRKFSISLRDLSAITQFELDANLGPFKPHFQYQVSEYNAGKN